MKKWLTIRVEEDGTAKGQVTIQDDHKSLLPDNEEQKATKTLEFDVHPELVKALLQIMETTHGQMETALAVTKAQITSSELKAVQGGPTHLKLD